MTLFIEQCLNGLQFGLLLFLLAAGLTLVFGIMVRVNLAHGSLYMVGAYFAATFSAWTGSFVLGAVLALVATLMVGMAVEVIAMRRLYGRDHLDHVLATFGLILFFDESVRLIWGPEGMSLGTPDQPHRFIEEQNEAEGRQHMVEMVAAVQPAHRDHLHHHANQKRGDQREPRTEDKIAGPGREGGGEIGADHVERAVRQVDPVSYT